jgi:hypothetical protein
MQELIVKDYLALQDVHEYAVYKQKWKYLKVFMLKQGINLYLGTRSMMPSCNIFLTSKK